MNCTKPNYELIEPLAAEVAPFYADWLRDFLQDKGDEYQPGIKRWIHITGLEAFDNGGLRFRKIIKVHGEKLGIPEGKDVEFDLTIRVHDPVHPVSEETRKWLLENTNDGR